ncbi:unnamed protein product [Rotaria sordida]|uniref:IRG-type G domain-containing protein n=1 Tax=Rotaria sordida TaxID=392033 RepID=A0A814IV24_9BILA|nr:unnamed protein product [Rotaria sordida]CAF1258654.1 unnamed protein product [Rotaria sordida]
MAVEIYIIGGIGFAAACWGLNKYFEERKQRMALNPSARKPVSGLDDVVIIERPVPHQFWSQYLNTEQKIQRIRAQLRLDTENTVNIAVCGNSGTGKSTFINCIRGVSDVKMTNDFVHNEDGSAPVGITETTRKSMAYRWWIQNRERYVTLWDLPAAGTISNPDVNYFEEIGLYAFDCILLLRAGRFTQFDLTICQQALKYKIPIVLVINKGDQDVSSNKKINIRQLGRQLTKDEYEEVISQTKATLKENALAELKSIRNGDGSKLHELPMFVIAAQSYRDQLNHKWDPQDSPALETENLLEHCLIVIVDHLMKSDNYHQTATN